MKNSVLNCLKLILYSFILLVLLNCNLNKQFQDDIDIPINSVDIPINSVDITNSIIYNNGNGNLNLLTENENNIQFT